MRRFLKPASLFVALGFSVALIGCDELSEFARDVMYAGTNVGYQGCIERNQNFGVSSDVIKSRCLDKHNRTISVLYEAQAGYKKSNSGAVVFSGWIENKSRDKIIIQFEISLGLQNITDQFREIHNIRDLWIGPGEGAPFTISDLKFVPKEAELSEGEKQLCFYSGRETKDCKGETLGSGFIYRLYPEMRINTIKGLQIKLR